MAFGHWIGCRTHALDLDGTSTMQSLQRVARSRISSDTHPVQTLWHENAGWLMFAGINLYRTSNTLYEAIQLHGSATRELTSCYGSLCAGWLPAAVEAFLTPQSAPQSVIPAPIQSIFVEYWIQRVAWSADGTQIQVISSPLSEESPSTLTTWDVMTGALIETRDIPFCQYNCALAADALDDQWLEFERAPSFSRSGAFQMIYEPAALVYALQDVQTGEIIHSWGLVDYHYPALGVGDLYFRWFGETLFFVHWDSSSRLCSTFWHPALGFQSMPTPFLCKVLPTTDLVLIAPVLPTARTILLDTVTGQRFPINFYAQDGAFSPDGAPHRPRKTRPCDHLECRGHPVDGEQLGHALTYRCFPRFRSLPLTRLHGQSPQGDDQIEGNLGHTRGESLAVKQKTLSHWRGSFACADLLTGCCSDGHPA